MRVIAGSARGAVLASPEGLQTRPTADRAREALFSILMEDIADCRFLDLFGGTGAVGIEALSRGAAYACFADKAAEAVDCIRRNLDKTKLAVRSEVFHADAMAVLAKLAARNDVFDIAFLDPPYETGLAKQAAEAVLSAGLLSESGLLVIECSAKEKALSLTGARLWKEKRYGAAVMGIYEVSQ